MERGLNEATPGAVRIRLRRHMPPATPYTFTHGDLTNAKIMVENEFLTGIVDWETPGYFPVWWEYVYALERLLSAINIVAKEQVLGIRWIAAVFKQAQEVVVLAVDITAYLVPTG
ncbi:hypothetical protein BDV38DRAFT_283798 [Aspergillus pseudotamarii]|uniref:Aminoglycoside phosphotransferase domain-containing protein n=1 Tax=Aspergillus pseudotamarii TaxID=132259 RepID=A0A5N6SPG7_ASPPS|nr:uncharacterized protein BDV38DRAFT_283798 [Aspergillus pseudotamarii]KAE8136586.1 hypothetical protein BDV38DRAFT_283798 [Aspergillus pseudotamarii]